MSAAFPSEHTVVLAKALSPDEVAPGWTALVIVAALGVAVWLLWRSMNTQLRKVPPTFDDPADGDDAADRSGRDDAGQDAAGDQPGSTPEPDGQDPTHPR